MLSGLMLLVSVLDEARAQGALIYADDPYVASRSAAVDLYFGTAAYVSDPGSFRLSWILGVWDVVVVESTRSAIGVEVTSTVEEAIARGVPVLFSYWDLDADPALQATLGLSSVTSYDRPVSHLAVLGAPVNFFESIGGSLTGATADAGDNGDYLAPLAGGWVAANGPGGATVVVSASGKLVINGLVPTDFRSTDLDRDGTLDVEELIQAELRFLTAGGGPDVSAGVCPGLVSTLINGVTPRGSYALLSASRLGSSPLPSGPCAGVPTTLRSPVLRSLGTVDDGGVIVLSPDVPAEGCSHFLQVVDLTTCALSPVRTF